MYQEHEIDSLLEEGLASLGKLLKAERGLVLMLKYDQPQSRHQSQAPPANVNAVYQWNRPSGVSVTLSEPTLNFRLSDCAYCQQAYLQAPQPLVSVDMSKLSTAVNDNLLPSVMQVPKLASLCFVPMMGHSGQDNQNHLILGFIVFLSIVYRQWSHDELDTIQWLATVASKVIVERRAQQRVQSLINDRTAQLQFMLGMQVKLTEKRQQQIDNLQRLNQFKDDVIANVSDALKTPLSSMSMAIKLLKITDLEEKRQRNLEILEKECEREIQLVDELLTLQKLSHEPTILPFRKVNVQKLLTGFIQSFTQEYSFKQLTWLLQEPQQLQLAENSSYWNIESDFESLKRILHELFQNAGEYAGPQTTVGLVLEEQSLLTNNQLVLRITNIGQGILPDDQAEIFKAFQRGSNVNRGSNQGLGIGLTIAKILVEQLKGTISVVSFPVGSSQWETTFTLTLPRLQPRN